MCNIKYAIISIIRVRASLSALFYPCFMSNKQ